MSKKKTKKNPKIRIAVVVDRSGSMQGPTLEDHIGGLKTFVKEQQGQLGRTDFTLVQFDGDDPFEVIYNDVDIDDVNVSEINIIPRGVTPLRDAVGKTLGNLEEAEAKSKSDEVIVMVITDGWENASTEWTQEALKAKVDTHSDWNFMFLGAGIDTFDQVQSFGIKADQVLNFGNTSENVTGCYTEFTSGKISMARNLCADGASKMDVAASLNYTSEDGDKAGFTNSHLG